MYIRWIVIYCIYNLSQSFAFPNVNVSNLHAIENRKSNKRVTYKRGIKSKILSNGRVYNNDIYAIEPNDFRTIFSTNDALYHYKYELYNLGQYSVVAEFKYGTLFGWIGTISEKTIRPGEFGSIQTDGRGYFSVGLFIHNYQNTRAFVQVYSGAYSQFLSRDSSFNLNIDMNNLFKAVSVYGANFIPVFGGSISAIIDFFWPSTQVDVWEQIRELVSNLIDQKVNAAIQGILGGQFRTLEKKLKVFNKIISRETGKWSWFNMIHYVNLAQDMVAIEETFSMSEEDNPNYQEVNYALLGFYTNVISLKMAFYQYGFAHAETIGLDEEALKSMKVFIEETISIAGAKAHIQDIYRDKMAYTLRHCNPQNLYNEVAATRNYLAFFALEYIPMWEQIATDPYRSDKPYNDVISFSSCFGRPTAQLFSIVASPGKAKGFIPKRIGKRPLKLTSLSILMDDKKIIGMFLMFEGRDFALFGDTSDDQIFIDLNKDYIKSITAFGDGELDTLAFTFSNQSDLIVGLGDTNVVNEVFEIPGHHIAGLYADKNSLYVTNGKFANLIVSYQTDNVNGY